MRNNRTHKHNPALKIKRRKETNCELFEIRVCGPPNGVVQNVRHDV